MNTLLDRKINIVSDAYRTECENAEPEALIGMLAVVIDELCKSIAKTTTEAFPPVKNPQLSPRPSKGGQAFIDFMVDKRALLVKIAQQFDRYQLAPHIEAFLNGLRKADFLPASAPLDNPFVSRLPRFSQPQTFYQQANKMNALFHDVRLNAAKPGFKTALIILDASLLQAKRRMRREFQRCLNKVHKIELLRFNLEYRNIESQWQGNKIVEHIDALVSDIQQDIAPSCFLCAASSVVQLPDGNYRGYFVVMLEATQAEPKDIYTDIQRYWKRITSAYGEVAYRGLPNNPLFHNMPADQLYDASGYAKIMARKSDQLYYQRCGSGEVIQGDLYKKKEVLDDLLDFMVEPHRYIRASKIPVDDLVKVYPKITQPLLEGNENDKNVLATA